MNQHSGKESSGSGRDGRTDGRRIKVRPSRSVALKLSNTGAGSRRLGCIVPRTYTVKVSNHVPVAMPHQLHHFAADA
jgi:hypothetical protein